MSDFCRACGAGIPPRMGEGRCMECAPWAVRWYVFKRRLGEIKDALFPPRGDCTGCGQDNMIYRPCGMSSYWACFSCGQARFTEPPARRGRIYEWLFPSGHIYERAARKTK